MLAPRPEIFKGFPRKQIGRVKVEACLGPLPTK